MNSYDNNHKEDEIRLTTSGVEDIQHAPYQEEEEKEIDLLELAMKLWQQKKKIAMWCVIGAIAGLIVAFSIPKEYSTSVKLAPEAGNNQKISGSLGAMAAMVGLGSGAQAGSDAVNPILYPDVVSSVPFLVGLFNVPVEDIDGEKTVTVKEYVENDLRNPWWSVILKFPFKLIGMLSGGDDDEDSDKETDTFKLTKKEYEIVKDLQNRINASVDTKTSVITLSVMMQDPLVSATLADTVVNRLQEYITDYRTNKARKDLEYAEMLNEEAQDNYYKAQQKYADYLDRNNGLILHSAQTTRERLQNEATLAFNLYNQTAQQVQLAKAKVQENTPVYATVTPATVPLKPTSPRKPMILIGFVFLAFVACSAWILYGKPLIEEMKKKNTENNENN
ncbi:MAG: chain-length determining protein [Muribaculaceae bacterium]|nr:chain-length determining protein [Muribaculaceae bacterium]MDE7096237.1 chain-length determining protein [Muribaculaceae bacterium]